MKKSILATLCLLASVDALACTGVIVGKMVSEDGSMIMARNEDFGSGANPKTFIVKKRETHQKGEVLKNPDTGFMQYLPEKTFKYTLMPDADQDYGIFGEAGFNEYGVMTSTTLSASANEEILKVDPYVKDGITEPDMASLILMQSKTAREGIEVIARIIDKKGAGEGNIIYVADKNEMWYMEIYTGHQYVAVKVPQDVYAVVANAFYLGNVALNSKDVIASKDILNVPKKANLLKEKDGKFHLAMTYREKLDNYNQIRMYQGQKRFNPSDNTKYDINTTFELFRKPERKIKLKDVMNVLRDRYDGTEFTDQKTYRPIGIDTNLESHIFQIKDNIPSQIGGVMWLSMGTVEHSPYLPYYGNITDTAKAFKVRSAKYNKGSYYWVMKTLNILGKSNRANVGNGIKAYWDKYEDEIIKNNKKTEKKLLEIYNKYGAAKASEYATVTSINLANKTKTIAEEMQRDVITHVAKSTEAKGYKKAFEFKK